MTLTPKQQTVVDKAKATVASFQTSKGGGGDTTSDPFIKALQDRLLSQSTAISSSQTNLEDKIKEAISGIQKGQEAGAARIESQFGREISFQKEQFAQQRTTEQELQRGFAVNTAALSQLDERTEKSLRDLEQRKQELILAGEGEAAGRISEIQIQAIQFRQQAEQQSFSNILNLRQFELEKSTQDRIAKQFNQTFDLQKKQFEFEQQSKMADIATEFGIAVEPEDTLQDVINRVKPLASAEQKARLKKLLKEDGDTEIEIEQESSLRDAIQGVGIFEEFGPMSPDLAALTVANFIRETGVKVTRDDLARLRNKAIELKKELDDVVSEEVAAEEGRAGGIFGSIMNMFKKGAQERAAVSSGDVEVDRSGQPRFKSIPTVFPEAESDSFTTLFSNLFGPAL